MIELAISQINKFDFRGILVFVPRFNKFKLKSFIVIMDLMYHRGILCIMNLKGIMWVIIDFRFLISVFEPE